MADQNSDNPGVPPVERVRQEVDRWLDAVRTTGERAMETLGLTGANRPTSPPVDVIELPEEVVVHIDLPGVSAETVELSLAGNMLTVAANRTRHDVPGDTRVHLRERTTGRFQRSIPLPTAVNDDAIRAETRDGLLTVTLRKVTPTPGRSIPVSRGTTGGI
jgi:HSP20 family protein